jgi:uncharacterized protein with HEPN domain
MISIEDKQHLMNIADAIDEIEAYVQGENYEAFFQDDMSKEAVTRLFQDIGGATKMLSDDFKAMYGDVDWNVFISLENAMYDQAYEVENEAIWSIIKNDIPILRQQVTDLAANIREEDDIHGYDLTDDPMTH